MPLYEYLCLACETHFDARRPFDGPEPVCPSCGEDRARRQFSVFASPGAGRAGGEGACGCGGACACSAH